MNLTCSIKSVRVDPKKMVQIDYRVKSTVKLPKGKTGNRFRHSTGIPYSVAAMKSIEKNKFKLAEEHFLSLFDNLENKEEPTLGDVAELALKEAEADRGKTDGTKDYFNILHKDVAPTFWDTPLKDIRPRDIKAWQVLMSKQDISQSRYNKKHYVLKRILDFSIENEYINSNPISLVKRSSKLFRKSESKDSEYFSKEEMNLILNSKCESENEWEIQKHEFIITYLHIAFYTGARVGEIISLKFSDIDFESKSITYQRSIRKGVIGTTKTGRIRAVPMVDKLVQVLLKWQENSTTEYLFTRPHTSLPYKDSRSIVDTYYKPLLKRLNLSFRVMYNTRHTFASLSVENGIPISTVSQCLGHSSIEITSRHYALFGRSDQNAVRNQLEGLTA